MTQKCTATRHNTVRTYRENKCRCPGIVARMRASWVREQQRLKSRREAGDRRNAPRLLTRDQVLDAYATLRAQGLTQKQIPRRLGLSRGGLDHHLRAARRANDPRAPYLANRRAAA